MLGRESYGALRLSLQKLGSRFVRSFLRDTQSSLGLIHLLSGHIVFRKKGSNTVVVILSKLQLSVGRGLSSSSGSLEGRRGCLVGTFCGADSALRPSIPALAVPTALCSVAIRRLSSFICPSRVARSHFAFSRPSS